MQFFCIFPSTTPSTSVMSLRTQGRSQVSGNVFPGSLTWPSFLLNYAETSDLDSVRNIRRILEWIHLIYYQYKNLVSDLVLRVRCPFFLHTKIFLYNKPVADDSRHRKYKGSTEEYQKNTTSLTILKGTLRGTNTLSWSFCWIRAKLCSCWTWAKH